MDSLKLDFSAEQSNFSEGLDPLRKLYIDKCNEVIHLKSQVKHLKKKLDKRGKLDKALSQFPGGGVMKGPTGGTVIDNKTRRQMLADRAKSMFDDTIMFAW